jgi:hypothetical protein
LLLLLLIPAMLLYPRLRTAPRAIGFPTSGELARLRPSFAARLHAALPWLRALVLALAVLALAGPQWGVETTRLLREGIAIAMVIDTSSSMSARSTCAWTTGRATVSRWSRRRFASSSLAARPGSRAAAAMRSAW